MVLFKDIEYCIMEAKLLNAIVYYNKWQVCIAIMVSIFEIYTNIIFILYKIFKKYYVKYLKQKYIFRCTYKLGLRSTQERYYIPGYLGAVQT